MNQADWPVMYPYFNVLHYRGHEIMYCAKEDIKPAREKGLENDIEMKKVKEKFK